MSDTIKYYFKTLLFMKVTYIFTILIMLSCFAQLMLGKLTK